MPFLVDRARNAWRQCCSTCHVDSTWESSTSSPASFNSSISRATHEPAYRRNMQEVFSTNPTIAASSGTLPKYGNLTAAALPPLPALSQQVCRETLTFLLKCISHVAPLLPSGKLPPPTYSSYGMPLCCQQQNASNIPDLVSPLSTSSVVFLFSAALLSLVCMLA